MYKCLWKDYGITDKWIPESYLCNTKEVLDTWKLKLKEQKLQKQDNKFIFGEGSLTEMIDVIQLSITMKRTGYQTTSKLESTDLGFGDPQL